MTSSISSTGSGISASLLKQMQEQMFKKADKNGDGKITADEMSQMSQAGGSTVGGTSTDTLFSQLDSNSDGAISRLESDSAIAKLAQQMQSQSFSDNTSGSSTSSTDSTSSTSNIESLLKTLGTALQSGNTTDANTALTSLEKLASSNSSGSTSANSTDNPFLKDLQTIGSDLASGNTTDAQTVLAGIQQKMHGHHHGPPPPDDSSSSSSTSSAASTSTASSLDSLLKTLGTALQSGNTTDASTALASLEKQASSNNSDTSNSDMNKIFAAAIQNYLQQSSLANANALTSSSQLSSAA